MSNQPRNPTVGGTLAGGIQDVSAILPIIGTDQCERHVGSALCGGYCYAAAAPLSIFGSLGIVKAGVSVLISSISIPKFWVSHRDLRPSGPKAKVKQSMFFGARMLDDAGFKLQGDVAALIGMDGTRFKAETKLIQILEEKHIDNPENISIKWKSKQWNIMLVLFTIIAAAMSGVPYFSLLLGPASWRPTIHLPWLFPFLRTVGSCLASVCCQFIIQSRMISSMKNRILFMNIRHHLANGLSKDNKASLDDWLKYHLQWDSDLPAEQCIRNLQQTFHYFDDITEIGEDLRPTKGHISIEMPIGRPLSNPPQQLVFKPHFSFHSGHLHQLCCKSFPTPMSDRAFVLISWVVLLFSLPATVAGYVGCFTLVGSTPGQGNGPLVWLGLEAALSIVRIVIWAWNPKFDEDTDVTVEVQLDFRQPVEWTEELNAFIHDLENEKTKPLFLLPERQFLEAITPYSGPLDHFQSSENMALYFTLMADNAIQSGDMGNKYLSLLITVFDFNARIGVTLIQLGGSFYYFDADVQYEAAFSEINASLRSTMRNIHPWQTQVGNLFNSLEQHYASLLRALNRTHKERGGDIAELNWKWDLTLKPTLTTNPCFPHSPGHNLLYPDQRYEHHLKTKLIGLWSRWVLGGMNNILVYDLNDCYEALEDVTSEKAKWELTARDWLVAWEWAMREWALVASSLELEDILQAKMEKSISQLSKEQDEGRLEAWMRTGFEISRRKRLENEKGEAKERMKKAMKEAGVFAEQQRRPWKEQGRFAPKWKEGIELIDAQWSERISRERGATALGDVGSKIDNLSRIDFPVDYEETARYDFVDQVKRRFAHWDSQRENEWREMDAAIDRIRNVDRQREQLDSAYEYPEPDSQANFKFAWLQDSTSKGKACSAIVYDARRCDAEMVYGIIEKSTTRSVINVDTKITSNIPPNDHLLFLSCDGEGLQPAFVQHNLNRWWDEQTTNSALFFFTPKGVTGSSCFVSSGAIARIFIFLKTPSRVRLRLLHRADNQFLLSIQQKGETLCTLSDGIPEKKFKLQVFELEELGLGRHELQAVVARNLEKEYEYYYLRDVLIEFFEDPGQNSSASAQ